MTAARGNLHGDSFEDVMNAMKEKHMRLRDFEGTRGEQRKLVKELNTSSRGAMRHALNDILKDHARTRVNGNVASHNTTTSKGETLHTIFNDLWDINYKIGKPENLGNRHVDALCKHWHKNGIAVSTMHTRLSVLRSFVEWIGKANMVKSLPDYLPDVDKSALKVKKVALTSKSWTENGIDVLDKINLADALDPIFGLMLRMCLAFGLRRMEVVQFRPHKSDMVNKIRVYEAKNGLQRDIDIETQEQREVLDMVKKSVAKGDHIGWKETARGKVASLEYSLGRYDKSMAKIGITRLETGVTGHGLRAQFTEFSALIAHMIPPTLGGRSGQMSKEDLDIIRAKVSAKLGHKRISITVSYCGAFGRDATPDEADRCKKAIEKALAFCHSGITKAVPAERLEDCKKLVGEMEIIGVEMSLRQSQLLWEIESEREGHHWVRPRDGNAEAMEAAANTLVKYMGEESVK
ncbi:phage integrase N-terminal domain-containing protein [Oxalobacteraceae bacterium R-40]|uniref:Phage integrase N-terminal domain-containing protein n=1 Tax=Keguizhuia sedimenti TaxID=3064264 RepID=A0ABU1BSN7_9BURK|nr:phage integrase N-terminal domain-containing protein [Oxalobacteraceae bacterium R-40]